MPQDAGVAVAVDDNIASALRLHDTLRDDVGNLLDMSHAIGIKRIVIATGDKRSTAQQIVKGLPIDALHAEMSPEEKSELIATESRLAAVMMVGDGVNDAPTLAVAGVAMGVRGDSGDRRCRAFGDRISTLGGALRAAQQARSTALQSVVLCIGLSVAGMGAAALGCLTPVQGALLQEVIDVAAILNELRALGPRTKPPIALRTPMTEA